MTITVKYHAPLPLPPGDVTITMPLEMAQKLSAMLGHTNGCTFDPLHTKLHRELTEVHKLPNLRMRYKKGADEELGHVRECIDLHSRYEFYVR